MSEQVLSIPEVSEASAEFSAQIYCQVSLRVTNGRCFLERSSFPVGDKAFVGLYENAGIRDPWGSKAWKWSSETDFPYATNINAQAGYVAMYYGYDFVKKEYVLLAVTPKLTDEIIAAGGTVTGQTSC